MNIGIFLLYSRGGKIITHGPNVACCLFCRYSFISTQLHPCIYLLAVAAFTLKQQSWVFMTETMWVIKAKIFTICSLTEKFCQPLLYFLCLSTSSTFSIFISSIFYIISPEISSNSLILSPAIIYYFNLFIDVLISSTVSWHS